MENKDKILMADGRIINRTYFLQDLKVGDELVGYQSYWGKVDQYVVESIGEEYAILKRWSSDYKMLLKDGIFQYEDPSLPNDDLSQFNILFFKTQEELDAYLDNLKSKKHLKNTLIDLLSTMNVEEVDIELVMKMKAQLTELLQ